MVESPKKRLTGWPVCRDLRQWFVFFYQPVSGATGWACFLTLSGSPASRLSCVVNAWV